MLVTLVNQLIGSSSKDINSRLKVLKSCDSDQGNLEFAYIAHFCDKVYLLF